MRPWVGLIPEDWDRAFECATRRNREASALGCIDRFGQSSTESHYWGALGELAFARFLGVPWLARSSVWAVPDVGRYEVRSISPGHRLYVKAKGNDASGLPVAVVSFRDARFAYVHGWLYVEEIRRLGRLEDPGDLGAPAHFLRDLTYLHKRFPELVA